MSEPVDMAAALQAMVSSTRGLTPSGLYVPEVNPEADTATWALAYAEAGWYGGPLEPGSKSPGSILGAGWQQQTTRDRQVIIAWLAGRSLGWFLHVGRSGAVVFDIDHPTRVPTKLAEVIPWAPFQQTRPEEDLGRGHSVWGCPPGRRIGNGTGRLGKGWGEVRGVNGVIVAAPTPHPDGGCYRWPRTGVVPVLPDEIAGLLDDATQAADTATDAAVRAFLEEHTGQERPTLLQAVLDRFTTSVAQGASRHDTAVECVCWAMREAAAGYYPADKAVAELGHRFVDAVGRSDLGSGRVRTEPAARDEFAGIGAWAVGQVQQVDPDAVRAAVDERTTTDLHRLGGMVSSNGQQAEEDHPSTWMPVDLAAAEATPEPPRWLTRAAHHPAPAVPLIYPGRVHWIAGEPESGKTWVALVAVAEAIELGDRVAFLDFEDNQATFITRLAALGVNAVQAQEAGLLRYVRPGDPLTGSPRNEVALADLIAWQPRLVVIDGVTEAMTLEGQNPGDNADTARWVALLATRLSRAGAAVVCVDHVTKSREERGRWAIGAQHKLAAVNGASFVVETARHFGRALVEDEVSGALLVRLAKDRPGWLRAFTNAEEVVAEATVTAFRSGDLHVELRAPGTTAQDDLARRIVEYLAVYPGAPKRALRELGNSDTVDRVVLKMVRDHHVVVTSQGSAHRHELTAAGRAHYGLQDDV